MLSLEGCENRDDDEKLVAGRDVLNGFLSGMLCLLEARDAVLGWRDLITVVEGFLDNPESIFEVTSFLGFVAARVNKWGCYEAC